MGWSHPDISIENLINLIKGFIDILILSSGYQSSGKQAIWDPSNLKKALQWSLFFQDVFRRIRGSDDYEDSMKELDLALHELKSNPYFPQGLSGLSAAALTKAGEFVVKHIIQTLDLKDDHLISVLTATVEMDLDDLRKTETDCLDAYAQRLMLEGASINQKGNADVPDIVSKENSSSCHSGFLIQELLKRKDAVLCVSSVELALDVLSESATYMCKGISRSDVFCKSEEQFTEYNAWIQWRSRNLSYLLDKRTVRLVSGAKLIFSAPKVQWLQIFERLQDLNADQEDFLEMIEILLLGCVLSKWSSLIQHFVTVSHRFISILNQYQELQNLPQGKLQSLHTEQVSTDLEEDGILEYLMVLLSNQLHILWKLSPILAAMAIPSWLPLFRLYTTEIEKQFIGDSPTISCCSCIQDEKKHVDCELGERIWCLYVFHIQGSPNSLNNKNKS
ncbi:hypothetical protein ACHQM5_014229 [Ranunculus cassubicifolius]